METTSIFNCMRISISDCDRINFDLKSHNNFYSILNQMLESRAKELDEALSRFTGEQGKAYLTKQRKIGSLKTKIASISDPVALEAAISKYQNQCHQLEALRQRHHDETTAKRKAVQEELNSALQILTDQKEYTQTMFRKLGEYIQDQETFQVKVSAEMDLSSSTTF